MVRQEMRIAAVVVVFPVMFALSGCGGGGSSAPKSPSSWGRTTMVAPSPSASSPSPSPSSSPSPQPSETFSPEQQEAAATIIEYFRRSDEIQSNLDLPVQPLADITTGQTQDLDLRDVDEFRSKGWVQTGDVKVYIKGAEEPTDLDGSRVVQVQVCSDSSGAELIDSKTGEKVLNPTRPRFLLWQMQVIKPATVWLVGDATNEVVGGC